MSLASLKMDNDVEKATDSLGSGGVLDTDIYKATIQTIYLGKSKGGAMSATIIAKLADREFKSTQWITSGDAKGNKPFYERNGKKYPLPGYTVIDDLCQLTAGVSLGDAETEDKMVGIYDYDLKKDVPTEVDCIADVKGEVVNIAIQKQLEDKNTKNDAGDYVASGETRETNEVAKVLREDGATWKEVCDDSDIVYAEKWLSKNQGKIRDRTSKEGGKVGVPTAAKRTKKPMFS